MFKNVSGQKVKLQAIDSATGRPKTGDAANITAYVSKDNGAVTALADTTATELSSTNAQGVYVFDLSQAETNGDDLLFSGKSTTAGIDIVPLQVYTTPPNFTTLGIDTNGRVKQQSGFSKNVAALIPFGMTDSTNHNPANGKTVTVTRSIDGGAFVSGTIGSVTEVSAGAYVVAAGAGDLNGSVVIFRFQASGCDDNFIAIVPDA